MNEMFSRQTRKQCDEGGKGYTQRLGASRMGWDLLVSFQRVPASARVLRAPISLSPGPQSPWPTLSHLAFPGCSPSRPLQSFQGFPPIPTP